jgi:hypothetical protein
MINIREVFKSQLNSSEIPKYSVSENFEDMVFTKIKRKETFRKRGFSIAMIFIILFLFLGLPFLKHNNIFDNFLKSKNNVKKDNIPIVENMNFASSDSINNYAIEMIQKNNKVRRPL